MPKSTTGIALDAMCWMPQMPTLRNVVGTSWDVVPDSARYGPSKCMSAKGLRTSANVPIRGGTLRDVVNVAACVATPDGHGDREQRP
jgi:hypothetical protein